MFFIYFFLLINMLKKYNLSENINNNSKNNGMDQRNIIDVIDKNITINFMEIFDKKKLLDILLNNDINNNSKIDYINNYYKKNDIKVSNITSGNIYKDWDFIF